MKRFYRVLMILAVMVVAVVALAITANAAEMKTGIGIVEANGGLRLREGASTDTSIVTTAYNGENVVIVSKEGDWYKVIYNLKAGYMCGDYLRVKERENIELGYGVIEYSLVNIRSGPSTASGLVDQASDGEKVFIFGFNCGWYKVKYNGQIGYVRSDLVALTEVPYSNYAGKGSSSSGSGSSSSSSSTSSSSSSSSSASAPSYENNTSYDTSSIGAQIATYAQKFVGYPYVYGGTSPSGFDCSGFVQYIYRQFGCSINRTATAQLGNGYSVSYDDLRPGDLVFFGYGSSASHVGMYIGGGQFVHAQNSSTGVVISNLAGSYASRYIGARRIAE